ncbi:hypothetical protein IV102_33965, partial [bacterium]|nr:hypothetical protein [bacterium]
MAIKKPTRKKLNVWQAAVRPSGATFEDGCKPQDLVLWVERESNRVRHMSLVEADSALEPILKRTFAAAQNSPMPGCQAGCPTEIQVDDERLLATLEKIVQNLPIQVTLQRRLDSLDQFFQMMLQSLEMGPGFAYLDGTQIQPAEIKSLALETIEFLEAQPFDEIDGDDILRVDGLHVSPVYLSVLGMADIEYGLGIYLTRETAVAYGEGIDEESAARLPALSLTLVTEEDCPPGLDVEIRKNRWPCHPMGFPLLMRVDGERV